MFKVIIIIIYKIKKLNLCRNWTLNKLKSCRNWTLNKLKPCRNWTLNKLKSCRNWTLNKLKPYRNWGSLSQNVVSFVLKIFLSVILRQFHKTCRKINRKLRISPTTKYYDRSYDHTYNFRKTKIPWQRYFHFWKSCAMDTSDVNKNIVC
jgi:hypothetical protein